MGAIWNEDSKWVFVKDGECVACFFLIHLILLFTDDPPTFPLSLAPQSVRDPITVFPSGEGGAAWDPAPPARRARSSGLRHHTMHRTGVPRP